MRRRILFAVVAVAAVALRIATLGRGWHLDEFASLEVARAPSFAAAMGAVRRDPHHPAFFALLWAWYRVDAGRAWLRALPLAFDLVALALVGRALWRPVDPSEATRPHSWRRPTAAPAPVAAAPGAAPLVAFGLYATNPLVLRFATELRPYSALMCAGLCSYLALDALLATPGRRLTPALLFAGATTAAVWLHPVGILAVASVLFAAAIAAPARIPALMLPAAPAALSFVGLHWGFTLDPSAARIGWMPAMSWELFVRILGVCFGLEDSEQYGTLGRALYLGGAGGVALVAWLGWQASRAPSRLRPAAAAAAALLVIVVAYSLCAQSIFWYRSLAPAVVLLLLAAGAGLVARGGTAALGAAGALVLVHLLGFLPIATRAVDPTEEAARRALAALGPAETLYVYPDWLDTTVRPQATSAQLARVRPLADAVQPGAAPGVLLVRCNLQLLGEPGGLGELLAQLPAGNAPWRQVLAIHDDNDDLAPASQLARQKLLRRLEAAQPRCRVTSSNAARIAELAESTPL